METIGQRIFRLRTSKGWSRPELGRQMALKIGRAKPFSGELVRLYEEGKNEPSNEARGALAKVFDVPEAFIEFGVMAPQASDQGIKPRRRPAVAGTSDAEKLFVLIQTFLDTDDEGRAELLKAAAVAKRHGAQNAKASRGKRR